MHLLPQAVAESRAERSVRLGQSQNNTRGQHAEGQVQDARGRFHASFRMDLHMWRGADLRPPRGDENDAESHATWVLYACELELMFYKQAKPSYRGKIERRKNIQVFLYVISILKVYC